MSVLEYVLLKGECDPLLNALTFDILSSLSMVSQQFKNLVCQNGHVTGRSISSGHRALGRLGQAKYYCTECRSSALVWTANMKTFFFTEEHQVREFAELVELCRLPNLHSAIFLGHIYADGYACLGKAMENGALVNLQTMTFWNTQTPMLFSSMPCLRNLRYLGIVRCGARDAMLVTIARNIRKLCGLSQLIISENANANFDTGMEELAIAVSDKRNLPGLLSLEMYANGSLQTRGWELFFCAIEIGALVLLRSLHISEDATSSSVRVRQIVQRRGFA